MPTTSGRRTLLVVPFIAALVLAPSAALADPATPLAATVEAASGTTGGVTDAATEAASNVTDAATEIVEETAGTVTETAAEPTETVTEAVDEATNTVTETAADAAGSLVETASGATQAATEASGAGESAEDVSDSAIGTPVDSTAPRNAATGSRAHDGTTTTSPSAKTAGAHTGPVATAPAPLGAGPLVGEVSGVGGSASWFGEAGSSATSRPGHPSGAAEAPCETNLRRGLGTAIVPCSARASVLGSTLGVTGVAVLSLLALALALSVAGSGALSLERRLQRG